MDKVYDKALPLVKQKGKAMSIYIDAEWLKAEFPHNEDWNYPVNTNSYVVGMIDEAPHIDIVKCKECIWRDIDNQGEEYCMYVKGLSDINESSFCSWGERTK